MSETIIRGWAFHIGDNGVHVLPNDEQHYETECSCRPEVNSDGLIIHNSFDGREAFENGERKPS